MTTTPSAGSAGRTTADVGADPIAQRLAAARARRAARVAGGSGSDNDVGTDRAAPLPPRPPGPPVLSSAQRRFWFLRQLDPRHDPFVIPIVARMHGRLDVDRLAAACRAVVVRHEALRTRITEVAGAPVPVLDPEPADALEVLQVDESDLDRQLAATIAARFDLAGEQPWRIKLLRTGDSDLTLAAAIHHVACDGWSIGVFLAEVAAQYRGDPLPELRVQYSDVAHYRTTVEGREGAGLDYWTEHLAGAPTRLELPTDRPRGAHTDPTADRLVHTVSPRAGAALVAVMQQTSATAFMALLAAWHVVLGRWADTDDVVIGTAVAGRTRGEIEPLIGCFVETLALRTRTGPRDTVRDLIEQAKLATLGGLANQAIGHEQVVEALQPDRTTSMSALYDVSLTVHTEPAPTFELPGIRVQWPAVGPGFAQTDLAISAAGPLATGSDGELTLTMTWVRELFEPSTIRRLIGHLEQVLVEMAADPDRPVGDLQLLGPAERDALPARTGRDVPAPGDHHDSDLDSRAVHVEDLVFRWATHTPDAVAVSSNGGQWRYRELRETSLHIADRLAAVGVRRGDLVGVVLERSGELIAGMLGVMAAGAGYVPIDPTHPDSRIAAVLDKAGVRAVITQLTLADRVDGQVRVLVDDLDDAAPRPAPAAAPPATPTAGHRGARDDDLAYVLFTSGTTGEPKGVAVEHRHLLAYLAGARQVLRFEDGWSWAMLSTPAADLGLTNILGALTTGGHLHLLSYQQAIDPPAVAAYFAEHRIDAVKMVPSHLQALWDPARPTAVLPRRLLVLAGEGLDWQLADRIAAAAPDLALHNHYGPTETTVSTMRAAVAALPPESRRSDRPVPIGRPFPGTRAHVLDRGGRPVPVGVPGELVIAGPTVARGYWRRPDLTAEKFVAEPETGGRPGGRAYRTGDLVRQLPDGVIEFIGRTDDQVKIRGYRVEPAEAAACLTALPGIRDAAVVLRDDGGRRRLVGYLVTDGPVVDVPAIRESLRSRLPDYLVPAEFVRLEALPLGANGKLDRVALPPPSEHPNIDGGQQPPDGATERRVAAAWQQVLGCGAVGATDNFFDLGGDSFATVRVVRALDGQVSVVDLFTAPTVRELAELIDRRTTGDGPTPNDLLRRLTPDRFAGRRAGSPADQVRLICVPFGGGSPVAFAPLAEALGDSCVVHGVQLPGHDTSRPDEPTATIDQVADALVSEVRDLPGRLVIYGHCLGGALAVELALRLEADGRDVLGVIEAGTFPAARLPGRAVEWLHRFLPSDRFTSDRAYLESLRSLGGFADQLDRRDTAQLIGALRHDSREAENYYTDRYSDDDRSRLRAPLLCIVGERDRSTQLYTERFDEWRDFADDVELAVIPGAGHFFVRHQAAELADVIGRRIDGWRRGERPSTVPATAGTSPASTRTFLLVAITQLLSMIGTGLTSFGLGIWVLAETGSVTLFATIAAMTVLPAICASPVAGAVADRYDRRTVMLLSDAAAGVATAALVVLIATGRLELWFVYLFAAVGALSSAFQRPAYLAAIAQLVPKRYLGQANGLVSLGINAGDLMAALLGGILIGLVGLPGIVTVDVITFLTAVTVIALVRFPDRLFVRREEAFSAEIAGGARYIAARRELVAMVVYFCVFNYLFTFEVTLATPLVLAGHSAQVLGVVTAAGGVGAMAGAALMALWGGTRRRATGMIGGTGILGICVLLTGLSDRPVIIAAGLFGVYGALLVLNAHWLSLIQTKVGLELQGRVLATNQMLAMAMMPIGFLTVGPITSWIGDHWSSPGGPLHWAGGWIAAGDDARGYGVTLLLVGLVLVGWCLLGLAYRPLRRMEDTLPDAAPEARIDGDRDALQAAADRRLAHVRRQ